VEQAASSPVSALPLHPVPGCARKVVVAELESMCNDSKVLFEYDAEKSRANAAKHGIDFEAVQQMWCGTVVAAPAKSDGEDRLLAVGKIKGKFWTAIVTHRGSAVRIISARRSRTNEIKIHQDHVGKS
jgi:uncharacterized DUF497 family protein